MHNQIVVVGSTNLDLVATVEHSPLPGETVSALDFNTYFGGKGANQAVAAAKLGAQVGFIGKVGDDSFGRQLVRGLEDAGVDVHCVQSVSGPSGVALILTDSRGENSIAVAGGANRQVTPNDIDKHKSIIMDAKIVLAQLELPMATINHLGSVLKPLGVPFMLDPAPAAPLSAELLHAVSWLTPNESEAQQLLGERPVDLDLNAAAALAYRLLEMGPRNVALKLGAKGVYLAGKDISRRHIASFAVKAVDTTGAGDAFNGAFAHGLVAGMSPQDAAGFACAAAACSVTKAGAQASMPSMDEVQNFIAAQKELSLR